MAGVERKNGLAEDCSRSRCDAGSWRRVARID